MPVVPVLAPLTQVDAVRGEVAHEDDRFGSVPDLESDGALADAVPGAERPAAFADRDAVASRMPDVVVDDLRIARHEVDGVVPAVGERAVRDGAAGAVEVDAVGVGAHDRAVFDPCPRLHDVQRVAAPHVVAELAVVEHAVVRAPDVDHPGALDAAGGRTRAAWEPASAEP